LIVEKKSRSHQNNGNARLVRNIIERSMRRQAVRLIDKSDITRQDLMTITREDMLKAWEDV